MVDLFQYFILSSSEYGSLKALVFLDLSGGVVWWGAGLKGVYAALGKRSALAAANISSNLLIYSSRQSSDDRSLPKVISSLALLGGVGFDNEYSYLPSIILWYTVWKNCPVFYLIHGKKFLVYSDMGLSPSGRQGAYPVTKSVCFESFVPFAINSCS